MPSTAKDKKDDGPFRPVPYREGNTVIRKYTEPFDDGHGNTGVLTKVDYTAKKGKLIEGYTLFVKWDNL